MILLAFSNLQRYPWNLYLISNVEDIDVFLVFFSQFLHVFLQYWTPNSKSLFQITIHLNILVCIGGYWIDGAGWNSGEKNKKKKQWNKKYVRQSSSIKVRTRKNRKEAKILNQICYVWYTVEHIQLWNRQTKTYVPKFYGSHCS